MNPNPIVRVQLAQGLLILATLFLCGTIAGYVMGIRDMVAPCPTGEKRSCDCTP